MEVSAFFKSKNPFPLESSLKFKVERKNLPSHNAMVSSARATLPLIYQKEVCRAKWHYASYKKECFKKVAQNLHFAKDVVKHRVPSAVPYKEYNHMHLYDFSSFMQPQVNVKIISKKQPRKLKPLRRVPFRMKSDTAPTKHVTTTNAPVSLEESIWKAREESTFAEPHLLVPIPSPPPPPPPPPLPACEPLYRQAFLTEVQEPLRGTMNKRPAKFTTIRGITVPELEHKDLGWEEKLLTKLSKATAQWIVNNQPSWGGWIQGKPQGFKRQKYDWNSIRYVLPLESDVELLDEIQAEENIVESCIQSQEAKQQEMPLPAYYRIPSFHTRVLCLDDPTASNQTADIIPEKSLKPVFPIKHYERLNSRVGKYSYTTQNVFEQDLYFGSARIVHQETKKDCLVTDNHDEYYKHLEQCYPRPPELWSFRPPKKTIQRVQKGAIHWTAPPTLIEDFAKTGEVQLSVPPGKKRKCQRKPEEDVPEEILIRRNMLQQWKAAWKYDPRWQSATIEGLIRDLVDVHVHNRINAILMCASAVLEQSQAVQEISQETVIGIEAGAKVFTTEDIPERIQPLLRNTLFDEDAHVRMAAAVCFYAIGQSNENAQAIMKDALLNGNSADSWTASQALALEGMTSFSVVKRILSQIFNHTDNATEDQAVLLLTRLSKCTGLVHCLLATELNSYQWKRRVLACKILSRIRGSVSQDLKNKIVQLMWTDWKFDVRQAAAKALGHLELGKEVHDQLRERLKRGNYRMRVEALSLIGLLKLMTARLLPSFLQCFSDNFVAVRKEACWAAGVLKIKEETVLKCLFKIMQTDPLCKIKALAIRALGQIGEASPYLKDLLLWALHYEEDPGVRREACRSIIILKMQDETVRATLLERMILEPNELVREELSRAVTTFNFEQEEEQEMIQKIKDKIATLSQKDLVIKKLLKLKEITENTWHEAHRIYREKGDTFAYREIQDIFFAVVQAPFTVQTHCPSKKFSKLWSAILKLLPWLGISPSPWTQKAFLGAQEIYNAEKQKGATKSKILTEKQKDFSVIKKREETTATVHFVPY